MFKKRLNRKLLGLIFVVTIVVGIFSFLHVDPVLASPALEEKWSQDLGGNARTFLAPLAANLVGDGAYEIVVVGGTADYAGDGSVTVLDGRTGDVVWQRRATSRSSPYWGIGMHTPFEIADLNLDGVPEIIIAARDGVLVLHGDNGDVYWRNSAAPAEENSIGVCDIDGDEYPEIFVNRGWGPYEGHDWITALSYDGSILNQAWGWHPCWGGLSVADTNFDGRFEIYQGDRRAGYTGSRDGVPDPYPGGGMGVRALDAHSLTPLWNDPELFCSSHAPMLADVDKDGILDVIVGWQLENGIAVLNSADGSVVTTGGIYRKSGTGVRVHSQPTVYDIDGDGNLEYISARSSHPQIWDLFDWELDAELPFDCLEPPKLGDVTGDGEMDIIAVASMTPDLYIYSYDGVSETYVEVEHLTGSYLLHANAFTLVQDVDNDSLNDLVLTSETGDVYCFGTPADAPTPRARSGSQFYSEYKLGAAEFVLPPEPVRPYLSDEQPSDNSFDQTLNPTLSVRAADFQENLMNITFSTNASGTWEEIQTHTDASAGEYSVNPTSIDRNGTKYFWSVNATDIVTGEWSHRIYSFSTQSNPPTHEDPLLVLTGGSKENFNCYNQTTADPDGNEVTNIYNWYMNDTSLTGLVLPFDTCPQPGSDELFSDGFESGFDHWDENGETDWELSAGYQHSGSYSAYAGFGDNYLMSDSVDTSMAEGFTVSFWYRDEGIESTDNVYLRFWNGSHYNNIFQLGNTAPEGVWHHYSVWWRTLFFCGIPDFHIRFETSGLDFAENLWIDDVTITLDDPGASSATTKDYSGYNNDGVVTGPVWTSEGVVGGAFGFDGNDRIRVGENGNSLGGEGTWDEISIEFWVKAITNTGTERLIWKHEASDSSVVGYRVDFRAYDDSNYLRWRVYTPSQYSVACYIDEGPRAWHHVVCTYSSDSGLKIYVDGVEMASDEFAGGNIQATGDGPLEIGYYSGSGDFSGVLDEVRLYPIALTLFQAYQRYVETRDGLSNYSEIAWQETIPGEEWKCQVTPNDGFLDGEPLFSNLESVYYENSPPTVDNLSIMPSPPTSADDLVASYDFIDPDGDAEYGSEIRWYKDNILQPSLNDSPTVPSSLTALGEDWNFTVRPNDFLEFGDLQASPVSTIQNAPPSFVGVHITPDPAFNTSTLTATSYGWFDNDGDAEGYVYQWQILVGDAWADLGGETNPTLDASGHEAGDYVRVQVTAYDGDDYGTVHMATKWLVPFTSLTDPLLVSSLGANMTDEDLTCYNQESTGATSYIYSWYLDDVPFTNLLLPFDTNNPSSAADYSGYSNNGVVSGATWTSGGIEGGAYSFDGDDVITVADSSSLGNDGTWSEITLEYWVNPSEDQRGSRIFNKNGGDADDSGKYMTGFNTAASGPANVVFFGITIGGSYVETYSNTYTIIPSGSWSHIVATYKSGEGIKLYINGDLKSSNLGVTGNIDASVGEPLFIGYSSAIGGTANRYLKGRLDDVRIYSRALSPEQAMQRYLDSKDGLVESSTIVAEETDVGDVWKCEVTPNDGTGDGTAKLSNILTVVGNAPVIDTYYPLTDPTISEGESQEFNITYHDPQGDPVTVQWYLNGTPTVDADSYTFVADYDSAGTYNVTVVISDGLEEASHEWALTVLDVTIQYELTIEVAGSGTTDPEPGVYMYDEGTLVAVDAIPDSGWMLDHWLLDDVNVGAEETYTVTMDTDHNLTAVFVEIPSPVVFEDSFESGDFSEWGGTFATSGETATVVDALSHHGMYSAVFSGSGDGGFEFAYGYVALSSSSELFARGYFRVESSGLTDDGARFFFMVFLADGNPVAYAGLWRVGGVVRWSLLMRDGTGWIVDFSDSSPSLGQWYCVELHWVEDSTAGFGELYVNGELVCSISDKNTAAFGGVSLIRFGLAELYNCDATTVYGDCFVASETYVGPEPIEDGFESGDFSRWAGTFTTSGETATVVDTLAHDGMYSGMFSGDGAGGFEFAYSYLATPSSSDLYARGYFRVESSGLASDGDRFFFMMFLADGNPVAYAGLWRVGGVAKWSLLMRDGTGWVADFSESSPVPGQWYAVELHWFEDSTVGLGELYVDDELVCSISDKNTAAYGGVDLIRFGLAELYNCGATTIYGDSFVVSEAYIGPELLKDGFESGDFSKWAGTTTTSGEAATVVDTQSHDGTYSAMFSGNGESGFEFAYSYVSLASSSELYARGYFNTSSSGLSDDGDRFFFMIFLADGTPVAYAGLWRVGGVAKWSLLMRDGTGWIVDFSDSTPSVGQWYCVELHWVEDSTAGLGELYVNGELVCSISGRNTAAFGGVDLIRFGLAELYDCGVTTVYGDCFAASEAYIGPEP